MVHHMSPHHEHRDIPSRVRTDRGRMLESVISEVTSSAGRPVHSHPGAPAAAGGPGPAPGVVTVRGGAVQSLAPRADGITSFLDLY